MVYNANLVYSVTILYLSCLASHLLLSSNLFGQVCGNFKHIKNISYHRLSIEKRTCLKPAKAALGTALELVIYMLPSSASTQLNSTQPQLKLRLRLALIPPDPASHTPTHPPPGTVDSTLHDYSRQIQGCFKTKLLLL